MSDTRMLASSAWVGAWKKAAVVGGVALAAAAFGAKANPTRFAFSYLFAFSAFVSVALGALFFVLVQHLTNATWSLVVRRVSEFLMMGLPAFVVLLIPILVTAGRLYPWDGAERPHETAQAGAFANASDEGSLEPAALAHANEGSAVVAIEHARVEEEARAAASRRPYLNAPFFTARALAYVLLWAGIAWRLFGWSVAEDDGKKKVAPIQSARRFAPVGMILFAVTVVFASFDWLMSLQAGWTSTIFGVYIFAGCAVSHVAALILLTRSLQRSGLLRTSITVEHYHDMGKLLFGWLAFWAYLAYVQFFLIWYAAIPHEVAFYHLRWGDNLGTWKGVSGSLLVVYFLVPFWLLMSRNAKRQLGVLTTGALIVFVMHVVEVYWIVMPNFGPLSVHWLDAACFLGVGGVYLSVVLRVMETHALIPVGDPRLPRSLSFEDA